MTPEVQGLKILLVEDSAGDAGLVLQMIKRSPIIEADVDHVDRVSSARASLHTNSYDCVLLDLGLPDAQGLEALQLVRSATHDSAIVVLTGFEDEATEIEALQKGAQDYLAKNRIDGYVLGRAIRYAVERQKVETTKRLFLDNGAHELRTPLSIISGAAEILDMHKEDLDTDRFDELVGVISNQGKKVGHLLTQLLELSELHDSGREQVAAVQLRHVIEGALEAAPAPDGKDVGLRVADDVKVWAHPERLQRIVINFLTNAYFYGGANIEISSRTEGDQVIVEIRDDGPGVPVDLVPQLFEPFGRGSLWRPQGSGLGLAVSKRLAETFDADVAYRRGKSEGASFEVSLKKA